MSQDNDQTLQQDELETLKARATQLGLQFHPSIGLDKLREKVAAKLNDQPEPLDETKPATSPAVAAAPVETDGQKRKRLQLHASELIRIRLTCMNPAKKEWDGEIFAAGNAAVGTVKKYVPYNGGEDGYHVPRIIYEQLLTRQYQTFYNEKTKNGVTVRKGKMVREFAIEVLPQLTAEELAELARRQAAAHNID